MRGELGEHTLGLGLTGDGVCVASGGNLDYRERDKEWEGVEGQERGNLSAAAERWLGFPGESTYA